MFRFLLYPFAALIFSTTLFAADWTVFHGLNGDNKSPDTGLLTKWYDTGPTLLWTAENIGFGYSSVSIAENRIYTSGNVGNLSMVFCLDQNGNKIWEKENGAAHLNARTYQGTRSTPTVDGNFVYDASALGEVACFDAKTGEKKWRRNLLNDFNAPMPRWILGHSLVVDGENLICMVGGTQALAVAVNKITGKTVHSFANPTGKPTGYATPYFFEFEGTRILALQTDATVEGYDPKTAKLLVSIPWRNRTGTNVTMPIYRDGHLFLTSGYGFGSEGYKLTKNADGTMKAEKLWHTDAFDNHHGGVVLVGDYVYGTTHRGNWGAINFLTGDVGFLARPVGEEGAVHFADGLIYGVSYDSRTVFLWQPNPKEFVERGRFTLPVEAEGKCWAHPVVINGKLYLRHAQYLYCYDVSGR